MSYFCIPCATDFVTPLGMATSIERKWGSAAHWVPLVANVFSAGTLGWLAVLGIYLTKRNTSPFVGFHAYQSLFFQGFMFVAGLLTWFVLRHIPVIGGFIWLALALFGLVVPIIGAMHASRGEWWRNPVLGGRKALS